MTSTKRHPQALALFTALVVATAWPSSGTDREAVSSADSARRLELDLQSFDYVWQIVKQRHWDPQMGGLDWNAVRTELRPQVEASINRYQTRQAIHEMLARLGASHYNLIPAEAYELLGRTDGKGLQDGDAGMTVCVVAGQVLVRAVRPLSPAIDAGVRTGWEILEVDGEAMASLLERLSNELEGSPLRDAYMLLATSDRLLGPVGTTHRLVFDNGHGQRVTRELVLTQRPGRKVTFGYLPPTHVHIEARSLAGGVGYLALNAFLDPNHVMPVVNRFVEDHLDAPGLVIDLRGNGGGLGWLATGMAGWLVDEQAHLGVMSTRETDLKLIINPRPRTYPGPVAILVDHLSASAAEIFTGGLQDLGRARVFGSVTAGAALPSTFERLANGDGFQCAFSHYVSLGGAVLEGNGISPDVVIEPNQQALLAGRDPVVEAALAWLKS